MAMVFLGRCRQGRSWHGVEEGEAARVQGRHVVGLLGIGEVGGGRHARHGAAMA